MTVYMFGWRELALRIKDGSIAVDLARPLDPQRYWLAYDLGRAPYHFLYRGVPPFIVGALVFDLRTPSPLDFLVFAVSIALAVVVSLGFRFLYNSAAFWLVDYRGVLTLSIVVSLFFSGMVLPIAFFPDWLRVVALAGVLALQAVWALALLGLGRLALNAGLRKLVIEGGGRAPALPKADRGP